MFHVSTPGSFAKAILCEQRENELSLNILFNHPITCIGMSAAIFDISHHYNFLERG